MSLNQQKQINILKKQVQNLAEGNAALKRELLSLSDIVKNKIADVIRQAVSQEIEIDIEELAVKRYLEDGEVQAGGKS